MTILTQDTGLRSGLLARMAANPDEVWFPGDFANLGNRAAVDKTLQHLVATDDLRRINRGPPVRTGGSRQSGCRNSCAIFWEPLIRYVPVESLRLDPALFR